MSGEYDLGTSARDLVELGTRATDEKISGVETRLKTVESVTEGIRQSLSSTQQRLEGINVRLDEIDKSVKDSTRSLSDLKAAISKENGYKEGMKDGFKVLHWVSGLLCAVAGGAITLVVKQLLT